MSIALTEKESRAVLAVVDLLDKHSLVNKMFEPHIRSAQARLKSRHGITADDASGLCAALWDFLKEADVSAMPRALKSVLDSAVQKLVGAQRDHPVFIFDDEDDGWRVCVNGSIVCGPFETEDRARFFWSNRPWPMTYSN